MTNPYRLLGLVLAVSGAILSPLLYFVVGSVPLTVVSISAIMLGVTCIGLANARPYISPEACQMLLKTGMENTAALIEELGLRNKAIYLPSSLAEGHLRALIPVADSGHVESIKRKLPGRLIVRYGPNPNDMAIAVATPGSITLEMLESKPRPTADAMESAMSYILAGVLDIAHSVSVNIVDSRVTVEVGGPKIYYEQVWYYGCLGSPIASIAAAIASEALGKPVRISEETFVKGKDSGRIALEVLA